MNIAKEIARLGQHSTAEQQENKQANIKILARTRDIWHRSLVSYFETAETTVFFV